MKRLLILLLLQLAGFITPAQDITRRDADSLQAALVKSKPGRERTGLLLQLAQFHVFKPGENKNDLDSASALIDQAKQINTKDGAATPLILLTQSYLLRERGQKEESKQAIEKIIPLLTSDKFHLGKAYEALASYYDYNDTKQLREMIRLSELAVRAYTADGNAERRGYALKYLADLYQLNDEDAKAIKALDSAVLVYRSIGYSKLQGVFVLYASIYYNAGNYDRAMDYTLMALKNAENTGDTTMNLCEINNRAGITLLQLNEKEKAMHYYKAALSVAEKYGDRAAVSLVVANIVHNYIELQQPAEALHFINSVPPELLQPTNDDSYVIIPLSYMVIYYNLKNYREVEQYSKKILSILAIHHPVDLIVNNFYLTLIRYYIETGQLSSARFYLPKIDSVSRKIGDPARIKENFYIAFRIDTAAGNYRSAVTQLLKFGKLKDSLFNEISNRQIKRLEVEYETEKKDNQLKLKDKDITALNQKNQLQQSNLTQAAMLRNITFGVIILLLIILWLIYRQFQLKQKTNKTISDSNHLLEHLLTEKEWLLKEIHHRVKNNFQTVMGLLGTQSGYLKNETAIEAIKESQHRIHSMSLIHQRLYQTENLSSVSMSGYIHELVDYLNDSFNSNNNIRFNLDIEPVEMPLTHCIPLGLILNEAITNCFKYAFPGNKDGTVSISLHRISTEHWELIIGDDGVGLPAGFAAGKGGSMGMDLMEGLSAELGAVFAISSAGGGTRINVNFAYEPETANSNAYAKKDSL